MFCLGMKISDEKVKLTVPKIRIIYCLKMTSPKQGFSFVKPRYFCDTLLELHRIYAVLKCYFHNIISKVFTFCKIFLKFIIMLEGSLVPMCETTFEPFALKTCFLSIYL